MAKKSTTKTPATKTAKSTKAKAATRKAAPKAGSKAALRAALLQAVPVNDGTGRSKGDGPKGVSPEAAITALLELAFDIAEDHDIEISIE